MATQASDETSTDETNENAALLRRAVAAFDDRDFDAMAAVHADDVQLHENGLTYTGYDAVEEHMAAALRSLGDPSFSIEETVADGDRAACRYTITATRDGESIEATAIALARIEDGAIAEVTVQSSAAGAAGDTGTAVDRGADNESIVRALYEAAAGGEFDAEAFLAPLADDVEWIEPAGSPVGGVHRGTDGVEAIMATMATDFASFEVVPDRYVVDGDTVAVPVTARFTLDDGEQIEARAVHVYDIEDDEIVRMENVEDTALFTELE